MGSEGREGAGGRDGASTLTPSTENFWLRHWCVCISEDNMASQNIKLPAHLHVYIKTVYYHSGATSVKTDLLHTQNIQHPKKLYKPEHF